MNEPSCCLWNTLNNSNISPIERWIHLDISLINYYSAIAISGLAGVCVPVPTYTLHTDGRRGRPCTST
jgi:hypothetical protein